MGLASLVFVAVIAVGVIMVVRAFAPPTASRNAASPDALNVLGSRYARGEIDRDEFEERRSTLAR